MEGSPPLSVTADDGEVFNALSWMVMADGLRERACTVSENVRERTSAVKSSPAESNLGDLLSGITAVAGMASVTLTPSLESMLVSSTAPSSMERNVFPTPVANVMSSVS